MKLRLDLHEIYNRGGDIDRALLAIINEAVAKKSPWSRSSQGRALARSRGTCCASSTRRRSRPSTTGWRRTARTTAESSCTSDRNDRSRTPRQPRRTQLSRTGCAAEGRTRLSTGRAAQLSMCRPGPAGGHQRSAAAPRPARTARHPVRDRRLPARTRRSSGVGRIPEPARWLPSGRSTSLPSTTAAPAALTTTACSSELAAGATISSRLPHDVHRRRHPPKERSATRRVGVDATDGGDVFGGVTVVPGRLTVLPSCASSCRQESRPAQTRDGGLLVAGVSRRRWAVSSATDRQRWRSLPRARYATCSNGGALDGPAGLRAGSGGSSPARSSG